MRHTKSAQQYPGERAADRHDDQRRLKQVCAGAGGDQPSRQRRRKRGRDGGGRCVRRGYGEGERAAQRHDQGADRSRKKVTAMP